ncbi:MAG: PAS domain S-box protein, partial [Verrucomicrobiaceae bacterium]
VKHPLDIIAPADHPAVISGIAKVFAEGESSTEVRILSVDGSETWHLCSGRRITIDGRKCLVGLGVDISERKSAEALLQEAQTRLELAVRTSGLGLWDWDIRHDRAFVSPQWRTQFGFEETELENASSLWASRLHPDDREAAVSRLRAFIANPSAEYQSEARVRDNDGNYRSVLTRAQLLRDEQGSPSRMLGCHIDVTQHRQTEERLRQQREQLRALAQHLNSVREEEAGRIARELHDELGAALTGLKIDINRLGQRLTRESLDAQRNQIQTILSSIDTTIRSVRKICLDLRPAVLDQLGLSAAVEWLAAEFQKRTKITCEVRQPESISLKPECAITVFRIFQELLTNIARHAEATHVSVNLRVNPELLILEVEDNGRGLPDEALTRHDRFGLLGVRERALAVGGSVEFLSKPDHGTRVVVRVPIE